MYILPRPWCFNMNPHKVICPCYKITKGDVAKAVENGAGSFKEVKAATKAGKACGKCKKKVKKLTKKLLEKKKPKCHKKTHFFTPYSKKRCVFL